MHSVKDGNLIQLLLGCVILSGCGNGTTIDYPNTTELAAATSSETVTADTNDSPIAIASAQPQGSSGDVDSQESETAAISQPESQIELESSVTDENDPGVSTPLEALTNSVDSEVNETVAVSELEGEIEQESNVVVEMGSVAGNTLEGSIDSVDSNQSEQTSNPTEELDNMGASQSASAQSSTVDVATSEPTIENSPTTNAQSLNGQCLSFQDESLSFGQVTNSTWRNWTSPLNFHYSQGPQFLQVVDSSDGSYIRQKFEPASNGTARVLANAYLPSERTYRLTQSVLLEPGFDWGGTEEGGKLGFGFSGGSAPSGGLLQTDGFSARYMWRGNKDGTANLVLYSYAADRTQNLPYGDDYPLSGFDVPIGQWIDLTMEVTVNSSTSASDGSVRVWANGVLRLERDNIQWQSTGSEPAVQALSYASFYGGNSSSWSPGHTTYVQFKNVCWAPVVDGNSAIDPYESTDVNAARLDGQTLDKQIFSDYVQNEQLALSPRGKLLSTYRQLELLLPTENFDLDVGLSNTLVSISEALVASNWINNYTLHANSASLSEIVKAQGFLRSLSEQASYSEFITSQLYQARDTLGETLNELGL